MTGPATNTPSPPPAKARLQPATSRWTRRAAGEAAARARILSSPSFKATACDPVNRFMWFYYINTNVAPFNNVHCRVAVEYAGNKTTLQAAYGCQYGGSIASTACRRRFSPHESIPVERSDESGAAGGV